jgi:hypothetical protein
MALFPGVLDVVFESVVFDVGEGFPTFVEFVEFELVFLLVRVVFYV